MHQILNWYKCNSWSRFGSRGPWQAYCIALMKTHISINSNTQRFPSHLLWAVLGEFFDFVISSSSGFLKIFKLNEPSVLGVLYKSLSEWNNCQLPVFEILRRTSKGPLVKEGRFFSTGSLNFQELHRSRLHMRDPYSLVPSLEKRELHWVMSECLFWSPCWMGILIV